MAFKEPFSSDVYIAILVIFIFAAFIIYFLARFSPNQWEEPANCIKDPEEYENTFTFLNAFWFTLGAFMQQGSDVAPLALCVRFAAGWWFLFALIIISSYTANLAAFLTVESLERPIDSVEDLVDQDEIWYGAVSGGSTFGFFEKSANEVHEKLYNFMSGVHTNEVMMNSNEEGVQKVEKSQGKYAFFMESASIEYLKERRCNLSQVGGLLDSKGYGIAMKHGTPFKPLLDQAILKLQEDGEMHKLKVKWWKQKRGGGKCAGIRSGGGVKRLGLDNVAGIFLVTTVGCIIAGVFAILEFLYGTKQSAQDSGVSWLQEMANELKFIFLCHGNTKEVGGGSDSGSSSSSSLSSLEARRKSGGKEKTGQHQASMPDVQKSGLANAHYQDSAPRGFSSQHRGNNASSYIGRHQGEPVYGLSASLKSNMSDHSEVKSPASSSPSSGGEEEGSSSGNNNTAARKYSAGNIGKYSAGNNGKYSAGNNRNEKQRGSRGNPFESVDK